MRASSEAGLWLRPQWYARPGEADGNAIINREIRTVRSAVGLCDVSTLGKIDIQGADAAAFLDRVYCNRITTLPVGRGALRADAARGRHCDG